MSDFVSSPDYQSSINAIGSAQGDVTELMSALETAESAEDRLKISMKLMEAQQKLTILSEGFTKSMKAHTDAQKAAITNMS